MQVTEIEKSDDNAEIQFHRAREISGAVLGKQAELAVLEQRCVEIEGLENPTTLDAKLATVRGKWKQVKSLIIDFVLQSGLTSYPSCICVIRLNLKYIIT